MASLMTCIVSFDHTINIVVIIILRHPAKQSCLLLGSQCSCGGKPGKGGCVSFSMSVTTAILAIGPFSNGQSRIEVTWERSCGNLPAADDVAFTFDWINEKINVS